MHNTDIIIENPNSIQNSIECEILPSENLCPPACDPGPDNQLSSMPVIIENNSAQVVPIALADGHNDVQIADASYCASQQNVRPEIVEQLPVSEAIAHELSAANRTQCPTEPIAVNPIIQSSYAQLKQQIQSQQQFYRQFIDEFNQGLYQHKSNGLDAVSNRPLTGRHKSADKILYNGTKNIPIDIGPLPDENCAAQPVIVLQNCVFFK